MPSLIAHGANKRLNQQPRHWPRQVQEGKLFWLRMQKSVKWVNCRLLQSKTVLDAEEAYIHVDDLPE